MIWMEEKMFQSLVCTVKSKRKINSFCNPKVKGRTENKSHSSCSSPFSCVKEEHCIFRTVAILFPLFSPFPSSLFQPSSLP